MTTSAGPQPIQSYHAHIYYDEASRPVAAALREQIQRTFTVEMGRWRDEPVGPHPQPMYQVAFSVDQFPRLVPWLMLNRAAWPCWSIRTPATHIAITLNIRFGSAPSSNLRLGILKAMLAKG